MNNKYENINECIACGSKKLETILTLNNQPLANGYENTYNNNPEKFPLGTNLCNNCFHMQLTHKVNPNILFDKYIYVSGTSKTQLEYFEWFADFVEIYCDDHNTVLDIGCNDGSQLDEFKRRGYMTHGVEPSDIYRMAKTGHKILNEYFGNNSFSSMKFPLIICQNAFAHNYDQLNFLKNMKYRLDYNGHIFITTSQANMILNGEFDTIYHEHLSFFNINSMNELCKRAGLNIVDVVKHPIHGTSYIFVLSKDKSAKAKVDNFIDMEKLNGLFNKETYVKYVEITNKRKDNFKKIIEQAKKDKMVVVGYGAPAKATVLMNYAGICTDMIIDDNVLKQNKFVPGFDLRILSGIEVFDKLKNNMGVMFIPMAWNFYAEIINKIKENRKPIDGYNDFFIDLGKLD